MRYSENKLSRIVGRTDYLPAVVRKMVLTMAIGNVVRFVGTAGLKILELKANRVHVRLDNAAKVQNHIGSAHAAAMALLAETATGFVVGMSVPDDRVPVIKSLKVSYLKRATGALEAVATLTDADIAQIKETEKGEIVMPVVVTDEDGKEPITCEMIWAWTPKRRTS